MIMPSLLFLSGLGLAALMGLPLVGRVGQAHHWRRYAPLDTKARRTIHRQGPAFTPLDLGPILMLWPSEVDRAAEGPSEPPWPSQTWDDEHFGAFWRRNGRTAAPQRPIHGAQAVATGGAEAVTQRAAPAPTPRPARRTPEHAATPAPSAPERAARAEAAFFSDAATELVQGVSEIARDPISAVQQSAQLVTGGGAPPTANELKQMVGQVGLAGTVQHIMERTGWDFRQAAQYLAQIRQRG